MASANLKSTRTLQASRAQRYGYLISLAARRGYSDRALAALLQSAVASHTRARKAVRRG